MESGNQRSIQLTLRHFTDERDVQRGCAWVLYEHTFARDNRHVRHISRRERAFELIELGEGFEPVFNRFYRETIGWDGKDPVRSFI